MDTLFSKEELFRSGWRKTKEHFWFMFLVLVVVLLLSFFPSQGFLTIITIIIGIFASISIITISLMIADGKTPVWNDLFLKYGNYKVFLNYLIASILSTIIVGVGLLLLIIPGIYLAIRLQFYRFLVVDKEGIGPVMALKESWRMTENHTWNLFLFMLLVILLNFVGVLLFGIGLFVTVPVSILAYAFLYRKLLANISLALKTA